MRQPFNLHTFAAHDATPPEAGNDNSLSEWAKLTRTGFYALNAFTTAAIIYGIGIPAIAATVVFSVAFMGFAKLGERR